MMKTLLLGILYSAMRRYVGSGVFDRLETMVMMINDEGLSGAEKRRRVLEGMSTEMRTIGSVAVAAALEIVVLKINA